MRAKLQAFGVAFAATLALGIGLAWAQQSTIGGGSSRPRFSFVEVRGAPASSEGHIGIRGAVAGTSSTAWVSFSDAAGARVGYVGDGSSSSNDMIVNTDQAGANLRLYSGAGGNVTANDRHLLSTVGATRVAWGYVGTLGGGGGSWSWQTGMTGTIVRNSTGNYTIDYTAAGFSVRPACVTSAYNVNAIVRTGDPSTATSMRVTTLNHDGTALDAGFMVQCMGT